MHYVASRCRSQSDTHTHKKKCLGAFTQIITYSNPPPSITATTRLHSHSCSSQRKCRITQKAQRKALLVMPGIPAAANQARRPGRRPTCAGSAAASRDSRKERDESPVGSKSSKTRPHYLRQQVACVCPPANLKWIFSDEDSRGGVRGGWVKNPAIQAPAKWYYACMQVALNVCMHAGSFLYMY